MQNMVIITHKLKWFVAALICLTLSARSTAQERAFAYPVPPESLETLEQRTSYLVEHFWDRANMKSVFSSVKNFRQAFEDYVSFMPYADSVTVFNSIGRLIDQVKKTPQNMLTMANVAREKMYSDTAEYRFDNIYLPFARAAASTSGIDKQLREQFALEANQLENTQVGMRLPSIAMTKADGSTIDPSTMNGTYLLLFFEQPGNFDAMLARTRLETDYSLKELIDQGFIKVLVVSDVEPDDQWREQSSALPNGWTAVTSPQVNRLFDRRVKPTVYYVNADGVILSKELPVENLVEAFRTVVAARNRVKEERKRLREEALKQKELQNSQNNP